LTEPGFHGKIGWSTKFSDDVFAKLDIGGLSLMASGYDGTGKIVWS
jgi:hypothetical protein